MKKNDVVVIGELNVDLILNKVDAFPVVGKEILARQMNLTLGSSSAIFASNLSVLGSRVAFIGKLGNDVFGNVILENLQAKAIDTSGILQHESFNTGATVVLNFGEERAMITHPGAMEDLSLQDINWEIVAQSRHLHISSYFTQAALKKDIGEIFKRAKHLGLTTSFDPQWDPAEKWEIDIDTILPNVDLFFPNEAELLSITRSHAAGQALSKLQHICNTVIIKQGNKGSTAMSAGKLLPQPAFLNKEVIDAIGAGDSFNAGFIYQYIQQKPLETCQQFGNLIAAFSTTAPGGTGAFSNRQDVFTTIKERYGYEEN